MDGTGKKMNGYGKLQFCGEQAKHDGLQYFCVVTCCIDKSNDIELVETIDSIFHWYLMRPIVTSICQTFRDVPSTKMTSIMSCPGNRHFGRVDGSLEA